MTWTEVQRKSKKVKVATSVSSETQSSSDGSRSASPNWSPCASPSPPVFTVQGLFVPQLDRPSGPIQTSTPKPMRPPPGLNRVETHLEPSGTELKYLPGCVSTVHLNYARRDRDWYTDAWRKDNDWRDEEEYKARYGVPLNSYTGDRINIPDDIPLRVDPIPISHQLKTLQPIIRTLEEMKQNTKELQRKQLLKIFDQELEAMNSNAELMGDLARLSLEYRILEQKVTRSTVTSPSDHRSPQFHPGVEICESILSDESIHAETNSTAKLSVNHNRVQITGPTFCYSQPLTSSQSVLPKLNANAIVFKPIMGSSPTMAEVQKVMVPSMIMANPKMPYRRQLRGIRGRPIQLGIFR